MIHYIDNLEQFNAAADSEFGVSELDIIVHKKLQYHEIVYMLLKRFTGSELFPIMAGTDLYTKFGYNSSVVSTMPIVPEPLPEPLPEANPR